MRMLERLQRWYNTSMRLDSEQRAVMYRCLAAQMRAGVSPMRACETLATDVEVSKEITRVAHFAASAGKEGRPVSVGLGESRCIPVGDLGVLSVAERNNSLGDAFRRLAREASEPLSIRRNVMGGQVRYFLILFLVLLAFEIQAKDFLEGIAGEKAAALPAHRLSVVLRDLWAPVGGGIGAYLVLVVGYGRNNWIGGRRRLLLMFDAEARARLGIAFCELAEPLYAQGANHTEVLDSANEAFGNGKFAAWAIALARRDHVVDGIAIEKALADRVMPRPLTQMVAGMVPGGQRDLYPEAFRSLADIQRAMLERKYGVAASAMRLGLLIAVSGLLLTVGHGIYTAMMMVAGTGVA